MSVPNILALCNGLAATAADKQEQPVHARAFAAWIQHEIPNHSSHLETLALEAAATEGPARHTAHVAVLGYAANLWGHFSDAFASGLEWLCQRQYFVVGRTLTFEIDGLALLGTALGILRLDTTQRERALIWLTTLLKQSLNLGRQQDWNESLIAAALQIATNDAPGAARDMVSDDLRNALAAKALMPTTDISCATAWDMISRLTDSTHDMTRAAAQLVAVTYILRRSSPLRFTAPSINDVARLLAGTNRSMRRWAWDTAPRTPKSVPAHWEIENEYHVQDMLWAILAPIFPDLDDEEWLKSLGHHHPRADLAIPSLDLIIEVKFMRKGASVFASVIKEVAADAGTYLQEGSGYRHIIAFVWDDLARTEQHEELRQGLLRIPGVRDAIILPRPSKMDRSYRNTPEEA